MSTESRVASPRWCRESAQRRRTCGRRLEKIIGLVTCASLLARVSLSILFASIQLARVAYVEPFQCWRSVREELGAAGTPVPSLEANLRLSWSQIGYRSDMSLTDGAFTLLSDSAHEVSRISRLQEKRRFRCQEEATGPQRERERRQHPVWTSEKTV